MRTILITGFGPFPGAPHNPTRTLVARLVRRRRPNLQLIGHVFATQYAAVDRELPALIKRHKPDAVLSFGLHGRAQTLRIETLARNVLGRHRDVVGQYPGKRQIAAGQPHRRLRAPAGRLARAARRAGVRAALSRDAGAYLCNYLCWRATESDVQLAAFVHVPPLPRKALRLGRRSLHEGSLERAALALLNELAQCLGSAGMRT